MLRFVLRMLSFCAVLSVVMTGLGIFVGKVLPRGAQIAYFAQTGFQTSVLLLDVNTMFTRTLHTFSGESPAGDGMNSGLYWSPNGEYLALVASKNEGNSLYLLPLEGDARILIDTQPIAAYIAWSPDSQEIVYSSWSVNTDWDIFRLNVNDPSTPQVLVQTDYTDYAGVFAPDGRYAYISDQSHDERGILYVRDLPPLTEQPLVVSAPIQWSPDGVNISFIGYVIRITGNSRPDLYVLEVAQAEVKPRRLTNRGNKYGVIWSPDGTQLAFVSSYGSSIMLESLNLREGSEPQPLTDTRFNGISSLSWSPDGTRIVFAGVTARTRDVYWVDVRGGEPQRLTDNEWDDWSPVWRPGS